MNKINVHKITNNKSIILFITLLFIIIIIFGCLNNLLKKKEHMSLENMQLIKILEKDGYKINTKNYSIKKCIDKNCILEIISVMNRKFETNCVPIDI